MDGHPYGTAAIGVAAEHAGEGFRREVGNQEFLSSCLNDIVLPGVVARQRAEPLRAVAMLR